MINLSQMFVCMLCVFFGDMTITVYPMFFIVVPDGRIFILYIQYSSLFVFFSY